jgi:hypothetical protein
MKTELMCNDHLSSAKVSKNLMDRDGEVFRRMNHILMRHIQEGGRVPWQKPADR